MLVQTLGLVAAQVFAIALDGFFQLTITLLILVTGGLALAHCHPFEQEGPQVVQVCIVMPDWTRPDVTYMCLCSNEQFLYMYGSSCWAARYNTWLLMKLTPKGAVFSFLFFFHDSSWTFYTAAE